MLDICIDVSHNNGEIDWKAVYSSGVRIAMIKATQGSSFTDPMFATNRDGAKAAGIAVIPYHFLDNSDPLQQGTLFDNTGFAHDNPTMALDWERGENPASPDIAEHVGIMCQQWGYKVILYMGMPMSRPDKPTAAMLTWPWWVPRYRWEAPQFCDIPPALQDPECGAPWTFWQYTRTGTVPGISTNVDRSVANFDTVEQALSFIKGEAS